MAFKLEVAICDLKARRVRPNQFSKDAFCNLRKDSGRAES
jgi:hypothetical protein